MSDAALGTEVRILAFSGSSLSLKASAELGANIRSARWHPSSYYVVLASSKNNELLVYNYDYSVPSFTSSDSVNLSGEARSAAWRPDGNYLAVTYRSGGNYILAVYAFSGGNITTPATDTITLSGAAQVDSLDWSADGNYLVVGLADNVDVYTFDGSTLALGANQGIVGNALAVAWKRIGTENFIAVGLDSGTERLQVYEYINNSLIEKNQARIGEVMTVSGLDWSSDDNFLIVGRDVNSGTEFKLYKLDSDSHNLIRFYGVETVTLVNSVRFSNDDNYIVRGQNDNNVYVVGLSSQLFPIFLEDVGFDLDADVKLIVTTTVKGKISINGNGHYLDFSTGTSVFVDSNSRIKLRDVFIKDYGAYNGGFFLTDKTSKLCMSNVTFQLADNVTTYAGSINVNGPTTVITKEYDWTFDSQVTLSINGVTLWVDPVGYANSGYEGRIRFGSGDIDKYLDLISGGTIRYAYGSSGGFDPALIKANSSLLTTLDGSVEDLDREVVENSNAIVTLDREVTENSNAIVTLDREVVENSNAIVTLDREVTENSNAIVTLDREVVENSNAIVTLDREVTENSNAIVTLDREVVDNSNAIVSHDLRILTNSVFIYNNSKEIQRIWCFVLCDFDLPSWWSDYESLAEIVADNQTRIDAAEIDIVNNSNSIINLSGSLCVPCNQIENLVGAQGFCGFVPLYNFIEGGDQLHYRSVLQSPINPAGSVIEIFNDVRFSSDTTIESSGFLSPHGNAFILGGDLIMPDGVDVHFTTSGIIDGQGHNLIFGENSKLTLDNYITLTLRNIHLRNLKNYGDGSSSISVKRSWKAQVALQNSSLCLDSDFTFSLGQLYIHGDVEISGTHKFIYTSTHAARIEKFSSWNFDNNSTFSYAPASDNRNLIIMADETSVLFLNGATIESTTTGLQLTNGILIVDHKSYLENSATSISQAIAFGDGNSNHNLKIEILPGASLDLKSGIIDYKNVI